MEKVEKMPVSGCMRNRWFREETYAGKKPHIIHIFKTIDIKQRQIPHDFPNINTNLFHLYKLSVHINSLISLESLVLTY